MTALAPVVPKIAKLIPRLASNHDGEVVATVHAIRRVLEGAGLDLHVLAASLDEQPATASDLPSTWLELATWCRNIGQHRLTLKEFCFVSDMAHALVCDGEPTEKQAAWLRAIYAKLRRGAA